MTVVLGVVALVLLAGVVTGLMVATRKMGQKIETDRVLQRQRDGDLSAKTSRTRASTSPARASRSGDDTASYLALVGASHHGHHAAGHHDHGGSSSHHDGGYDGGGDGGD